jgi:hypothetical protein
MTVAQFVAIDAFVVAVFAAAAVAAAVAWGRWRRRHGERSSR